MSESYLSAPAARISTVLYQSVAGFIGLVPLPALDKNNDFIKYFELSHCYPDMSMLFRVKRFSFPIRSAASLSLSSLVRRPTLI